MTTYHAYASKAVSGICIYTSNVPEPVMAPNGAGAPDPEQWMAEHHIGGVVARHVLFVVPFDEEGGPVTPDLHPFGTCSRKSGEELCETCCDAIAESIQAEQIARAVAAETERCIKICLENYEAGDVAGDEIQRTAPHPVRSLDAIRAAPEPAGKPKLTRCTPKCTHEDGCDYCNP